MNLAYFRTSTFDKQTTVDNVKKLAAGLGLSVTGTTDLPADAGTVVTVCNPAWTGNLIASDRTLIGLLPCTVAVLAKNGEVTVGVGSPTVLGSVSQHPAVTELAGKMEAALTTLINDAAGVGPLKPTGIKLYSTTSCPYCKMEAAWLDENKVTYEEVHVDLNQKEAEAMVAKTGQMGVPVTEVRYEGGEEEYIVGFDKQRLAAILKA